MSTWVECCDFAYSHPDPTGLRNAGIEGILRYFSKTPGKGLTLAERNAAWAAGLWIRGLYESTAERALAGYAAGQADARLARSIARSLEYPDDLPIIFAVDFQATATQLAGPVSDYFRGIASIEAGDEAYGGIATIQALVKNHLSAGGFQTYAWSSGRWDPDAEFEQYRNGVTIAGGVVDRCRALSTTRFWEAPMTAVDLTPAAITAVRDAILGFRTDNLPPAGAGDPVDVKTALRMIEPRTKYLATTFAAAVLGGETEVTAALAKLQTAVEGTTASVAAAVEAELPTGTLTDAQVAAIAARVDADMRTALAAADRAEADSLDPPPAG